MSKKFDRVVERIAVKHGVTPDHVVREMEAAMEIGMCCEDPNVQAMWASIPKAGEKLTAEEFVRYIVKCIE